MTNESTLKQAEKVREIVDQWYEPGRHDRCYNWVFVHKIRPVFGISKSTYKRYLQLAPTKKKQKIFIDEEQ